MKQEAQQLKGGRLRGEATAGLVPEEGSPGHPGLRLFCLLASNASVNVGGDGYLQGIWQPEQRQVTMWPC